MVAGVGNSFISSGSSYQIQEKIIKIYIYLFDAILRYLLNSQAKINGLIDSDLLNIKVQERDRFIINVSVDRKH